MSPSPIYLSCLLIAIGNVWSTQRVWSSSILGQPDCSAYTPKFVGVIHDEPALSKQPLFFSECAFQRDFLMQFNVFFFTGTAYVTRAGTYCKIHFCTSQKRFKRFLPHSCAPVFYHSPVVKICYDFPSSCLDCGQSNNQLTVWGWLESHPTNMMMTWKFCFFFSDIGLNMTCNH